MNNYFILFLVFSLLACKNNKEVNETTTEDNITLWEGNLSTYSATAAEDRKKDSLLNIAWQNYRSDSTQLENIIWYGRRLAYLGKFAEAVDVYTKGLDIHPKAPELFRHRGHRYITLRKFDQAIADFEKAAFLVKNRDIEIEPDGIPNKLNQPLSSLQFNIWYHWGLAYYLKGDFSRAAKLYETGLDYSTNPDLLCATTDWLYMSYRRLGKVKKAGALLEQITEYMEIIENRAYHNRLLMYKGLKKPKALYDYENSASEGNLDLVTQGYGVGNFYLYNRDTSSAKLIFERILASDNTTAFGYIAAEADMERISK